MVANDAHIVDHDDEELIFQLGRRIAELTLNVVVRDFGNAQCDLIEVRDRIDILAARQALRRCLAVGDAEGAAQHAWALPSAVIPGDA